MALKGRILFGQEFFSSVQFLLNQRRELLKSDSKRDNREDPTFRLVKHTSIRRLLSLTLRSYTITKLTSRLFYKLLLSNRRL